MAKYIKNKKINSFKANDIKDFEGIGQATWMFLSAIYESKWDSLFTDDCKTSFRKKVSHQFTFKVFPMKNGKKGENNTDKPASIQKLLPPIPAKSSKEVNKISKFFEPQRLNQPKLTLNKSYVQASSSKSNTEEILKIKEIFLTLKAKNIKNIQRIVKGDAKPKPRIHMTTKGLSRKQVIVPMSDDNKKGFMKESSSHITNINRALKQIKLEVMVDFICLDTTSITIVTNKVATNLNLQMIENYIKDLKHINCDEVKSPRLPQSKSYLKIIGIPYLQENSESPLNSSVVEEIIKKNHIFNNIVLASKPRVIKISPKSDIAII